MAKQTVEAMVEGGKASAGPPLGPALGPLKVSIPDVVAAINEKTKDMAGMKIPVKVIIDTDTKAFDIEVGSPPIAALIKKELGLSKGSEEAGKKRIGDLTMEQAKKVARMKFGSDDEPFVNQVKGTARSMGITVGQGAVTEEEMKQYEEQKKAEEEAKAAAEETTEETKEGEKEETEEKKESKPEKKK